MNPEIIFIDGSGLSLVKEDYAKNKAYYDGLTAFQEGKYICIFPITTTTQTSMWP